MRRNRARAGRVGARGPGKAFELFRVYERGLKAVRGSAALAVSGSVRVLVQALGSSRWAKGVFVSA